MSNYIATVIKTGNSYALRVPKAYVDEHALKLGQKVSIEEPRRVDERRPYHQQDKAAFIRAMKELQALHPFREIEDPVAWQREIRRDRPLPGRD